METLEVANKIQAEKLERILFSLHAKRMVKLGYSLNADANIVGKNANTGELEPSKQVTTQWSIPTKNVNNTYSVEDLPGMESNELAEINKSLIVYTRKTRKSVIR